MREYIHKENVCCSMDLDCLILNPAFINRTPSGKRDRRQEPVTCRRSIKRKEKVSDDGTIFKFVVAAVAVFAVALFV